MSSAQLDELIKKRQTFVNSAKENRFDLEFLANLYSDPAHLVYEILQNAEDAGAEEVEFILFNDRLEISHNAKKDFDIKDIDGVTGIGISTKKEDLNAIGKFGVGFKSVFAVTKTPRIFSGEYAIEIQEFYIPSSLEEKVHPGTRIVLPFNLGAQKKESTFRRLGERLENLGLETLLFLRNIKQIHWRIVNERLTEGTYLKETRKEWGRVKRVALLTKSKTTQYSIEDRIVEYLLIEEPLGLADKKLKIEVAYKLGRNEKNKEVLIPNHDSKLFVFFPTEKITFLDFLIQGPYKTTPNRENIPFDDEFNKVIIEQTAKLVTDSIAEIKKLGYLNVDFLQLLPVQAEHKVVSPIYSAVYDEVKKVLLSEKEFLPTSTGAYSSVNNVILARGKELTDFLDKEDIRKVYGKDNWLDTGITYDKTRELRNYLVNELGVTEVDFENFVRKITADLLRGKPDRWVAELYSHLLGQEALYKILGTKPIIRVESNEHISLYDQNGTVQVYLPGETDSLYKTVKRSLIREEKSLKFLKELGLEQPDKFAEIRELIVPKYRGDKVVKEERYFNDFEKLLNCYTDIPASKKNEFMTELSDCTFIYSINNISGECILLKPSTVYLKNSELEDYFKDDGPVYFVSDELYKRYESKKLIPFLKDLGVEETVRRIPIETKLSMDELKGYGIHSGRSHVKLDYKYEGLEKVITHMTPHKSQLLWKLLLKNIEEKSEWDAERFFRASIRWFYYSSQFKSIDADFLGLLRNQPWLIDSNGNFRKPSDITFAELPKQYSKEAPNLKALIEILDFKPDVIEQLPDEYKQMFNLLKQNNISIEEIEELVKHREQMKAETPQKEEEAGWSPTCDIDDVNRPIEETEPGKNRSVDLKGQSNKVGGEKNPKGADKTKKDATEESKKPDLKKIGRRGEEEVYDALRKRYDKNGVAVETGSGFKINNVDGEFEVVWLNKHKETGEGCDFILKKNGAEIEYIEVKSKVGGADELIEVTGIQWEFARTLYEQDEGDKYYFYVVSHVGTLDARINALKNPIKLWKDGKLYAHPVNFQL